jgi:hypothetical protein
MMIGNFCPLRLDSYIAGIDHNDDPALAKQIIDAAVDCVPRKQLEMLRLKPPAV